MKNQKQIFPVRDIALTHKDEISARIQSIDRQVDKLEAVKSRSMDGFDAKHDKIKKLNERKYALWSKRAKLIRAETINQREA